MWSASDDLNGSAIDYTPNTWGYGAYRTEVCSSTSENLRDGCTNFRNQPWRNNFQWV